MLNRVLVVGAGLIGCSFALALRRGGAAGGIVASDADPRNVELAVASGAVDRPAEEQDWHEADLVFVAVPVRAIPETLTYAAGRIGPGTVVTDSGSTKQDVLAAARAALGMRCAQFVPGHPIAGRERHGPLAADAGLFEHKHVVLTPSTETTPEAVARVRHAWQACGAHVLEMAPDAHDAVFAAVSHLPHLLAFALVDEIAARGNAATLFAHAASGFRDFTRIASSSPVMWRDVTFANRAAILSELDRYRERLDALRRTIGDGDEAAVLALMQRAQAARDRWLDEQRERFRDPA